MGDKCWQHSSETVTPPTRLEVKYYVKDLDDWESVSGQEFQLEDVQDEPDMGWGPALSLSLGDENYTLVIYDPDAPGPRSKGYSYLHLLDIYGNRDAFPYQPPAPPAGSGLHHYNIVLLDGVAKNLAGITRTTFDFDKFKKENNLKEVDRIYFTVRGQT